MLSRRDWELGRRERADDHRYVTYSTDRAVNIGDIRI